MYGDDSCPGQLQSQSLTGDLAGITEIEGQGKGKLDHKGTVNGEMLVDN